MTIKQFPTPKLKSDTQIVTKRNLKEAIQLGKKLLRVCKSEKGVGLAANQIDVDLRVAVISVGNFERVLFNPVILSYKGQCIESTEKCLSLKKLAPIKVRRYNSIRIAYQDEDLNMRFEDLTDFEAIVAQHEIDHLDGKTILNREIKECRRRK